MDLKEIVVEPESVWWKVNLRELWRHRELLYVFAWRDVKVKYKRTFLGILWVLIQPLATTGIFSIFFGKIAKIPTDGIPYPLFVFAGMKVWGFFSAGVSSSSNSLISNESILKKVFFPRLIIPISAIVTTGVDFFVTLGLLLLATLFFGYLPSPAALVVFPLLLLILMLTMAGIGMFMAAMNVRFRDVRYILPFFIQMGLYITPIIYPLSVIYDYRRWLLIINPLTAVVENLRALLVNRPLDWGLIGVGLLISGFTFLLGLFFFQKTERLVADIS